MISNCGSDERGKLSGGQAGDQGGEWTVRKWYNRPWNYVLRYPDRTVANKLAELARKAAENNLVGYDQAQRHTYWQHLKASAYDPSQITIACEADCSSGIAANVKAVGHLLGIRALQDVSADCYTGNLRAALKNAGFQVLTDSKYLAGDAYLLPGDILLYEGHHVATNLDTGSKAGSESTTAASQNTYKVKSGDTLSGNAASRGVSGSTIVRDGQIHANNFTGAGIETDGVRGSATKKAGVMVLQTALNHDYHAGLDVDGIKGSRTDAALGNHYVKYGETQYLVTAVEILLMLKGYNPGGVECPGQFGSGLQAAVTQYQRDHGLAADGIAGRNTILSLIA